MPQETKAHMLSLVFASIRALHLFLQASHPVGKCSMDSWAGEASVLWNRTTPEVMLTLPGTELDPDFIACAGRYGGRVRNDYIDLKGHQQTRLPDLFQHVRLRIEPRMAMSGAWLIIPHRTKDNLQNLLVALLELGHWDAELLCAKDERGNKLDLFRIFTADLHPAAPPLLLPDAPTVLAADMKRSDLFVPGGFRHPLAQADSWLLPQQHGDVLHTWIADSQDIHRYVRLHLEGEPLACANLVLVEPEKLEISTVTGLAGKLKVPLELHERAVPRRVDEIAGYAYRVNSVAGEIGSALLRLLDHAEAHLEYLRYYSVVRDAGANSEIEHYIVAEDALDDQHAWPELTRFELPAYFRDLNASVYLASGYEFVPGLQGLMQGENAAVFVEHLCEKLSFDRVRQIAMIEPHGSSRRWRCTLLEDPHWMHEVIEEVLPRIHRQPIRETIDVTQLDLSEDQKLYENTWLDAGQQTARESAMLTQELFAGLEEAATGLLRDSTRLRERQAAASQLINRLQGQLRQVPASITEFLRQISLATEIPAGPHREWLADVSERQKVLSDLASQIETIQTNSKARVDQISEEVNNARTGAEQRLKTLTESVATLRQLSDQLPALAKLADDAAAQAGNDVRDREARLQETMHRLRTQEQELQTEETRLAKFQSTVDAKEREVRAESQRLAARRQDLQSRLETAEQKEREAVAEAERLDSIEKIELPAARLKLRNTENRRDNLIAKGLDGQLRSTETKQRDAELLLKTLVMKENELVAEGSKLANSLQEVLFRQQKCTELQKLLEARQSELKQMDARGIQRKTKQVEKQIVAAGEARKAAVEAVRVADEAIVSLDRAKAILAACDQTFAVLRQQLDSLNADSVSIRVRAARIDCSHSELRAELKQLQQLCKQLNRDLQPWGGLKWFGWRGKS